jgi:ArsR family transcriptional regulator
MRARVLKAYEGRAQILKALAHPSRLLMIEIMHEGGDICVFELVEIIGSDQSTVSKHLGILKQAGLVTDRKDGQRSYYRLVATDVAELLDSVERFIEDHAKARAEL